MNYGIVDIAKQTMMVSGFVLFMMLIIEYINVLTKEKWSRPLQKSLWLQFIIAILLGLTPGCAGIFAVVSLFTHNIIGFPALIAASVATVGDEAFIMFALMPGQTLKLLLILTLIAIVTGLLVVLFVKSKPCPKPDKHLIMHGDECLPGKLALKQEGAGKRQFQLTFARSMLIAVLVLLIFSQFTGLGHETEHGHEHEHSLFSPETIIFFIMGAFSLFVIITVPEHFLTEHLWGHVIKKHFLRLFLWTLGTLIFINFISGYIRPGDWVEDNFFLVLLIAAGIGILPTSGPHVIFITLFLQGAVPFSILLVNSVVQDGHGGIPLLADDKAAFVRIKLIKVVIAVVTGLSLHYLFKL